MFEHLDDPQSSRSGTDPQLSAARGRGRQILQQRRRTRLAAGSAALAATAGITAVATVGLPGAGSGSASAAPGDPSAAPSAVAPPVAAPSAAVTAVASPSAAVAPPTAAGPSTAVAPPTAVGPSAAVAPPTAAPSTAAPSTAAPSATVPPVAVTPPAATPTASASPVPITPATVAADCASVISHLKTTVAPDGYTPYSKGDSVIGWQRPASPLSTLLVTVSCSPFSPADVPASEGPVKEVTVLDAHSWLVGDAKSGQLKLVWNPNSTTAVTLSSTSTLPDIPQQVENQLLVFGNYLAD
jgi:hypothetical protein